jgi:hypothetical protein
MSNSDLVFAFILWVGLTISLTIIGNKRTIGGSSSFLISLFFSPLIGSLFVFSAKRNDTVAFENKLIECNNNIAKILTNTHNSNNKINEDEL